MILFVQVMMAIIVAVLIDSMQELKFSGEAALQDLKMRCFVCDLSAVRMEQEAGLDFDTHAQKIHNPNLYLYFLIHLKSLQHSGVDVSHMTAVERCVLEKVDRELNVQVTHASTHARTHTHTRRQKIG